MESKPVALLYTRRSWVRQQDSTDPANSQIRQAEMSASACLARGWEVEIFSEPEGHRSGASEDKRPGFQALRARLLREPKPVAVVVWRLTAEQKQAYIFNFLSELRSRDRLPHGHRQHRHHVGHGAGLPGLPGIMAAGARTHRRR